MLEDLTEQQKQAALTVLEYADIEPTLDNVNRYLKWDILSFTEDARGHYCWYMDDEGNEICIHVETLDEIDTSELG